MKNIFKITLIFSLMSLVSCEEFLKEDPPGLNTSASSFKTESDAWAALNGVYEVLKTFGINAGQSSGATWLYSMTECADDMIYRAKNTQVRDITNFGFTPSNIMLLTAWYHNYNGIARANNVLENVDRVPMSDALKTRIKSEARFMRGFYHFYLVRLFGDIPLVINFMQTAELIPRTPTAEVYQSIISDFEFAYENLPLKGETDIGRATKGAAGAFLAKVYLTRKDWSNASAWAKKVIDLEDYTLEPNIMDYFDDNKKEENDEAIFEAQAMHDEAYKGSLFRYMNQQQIPENSAVEGHIITGAPMQTFHASWDLFFSYEPDDIRRTGLMHVIAWKRVVWPPEQLDSLDYPWTYKYRTTSVAPTPYAPNFPLMRYADVLLMYAESLNEENKTSEAYPWINMVRRRAFGLPVDQASAKDLTAGLSQSDFREELYKERRRELACEGHRWFDLVRTGRLVSTMNAFAARLEREYTDPSLSVMSRLTPGKVLFKRNNTHYIVNPVSEKHNLYPIPQLEIDGNPLLEQNPGY